MEAVDSGWVARAGAGAAGGRLSQAGSPRELQSLKHSQHG